jgi:hypothetical protein
MYETVEEVRQKLVGSVIMFDNQPVFVQSSDSDDNGINITIDCLPLNRKSPSRNKVYIEDPKIDFRSLGTRLGFINMVDPSGNYTEDVVYSSRVPIRQSKQGLDERTVAFRQINSNYKVNVFSSAVSREGLNNTLMNKFPSPKEAYDYIMNTPNVVAKAFHRKYVVAKAFHRKYSLFYDKISPPFLIYRNEKVGYTEDGITFKLPKSKDFLTEELSDMIGVKVVNISH